MNDSTLTTPAAPMSVGDTIRQAATQLLALHADGLRYVDLRRMLELCDPAFSDNTINGVVVTLHTALPDTVYKTDAGLYRLTKHRKGAK